MTVKAKELGASQAPAQLGFNLEDLVQTGESPSEWKPEWGNRVAPPAQEDLVQNETEASQPAEPPPDRWASWGLPTWEIQMFPQLTGAFYNAAERMTGLKEVERFVIRQIEKGGKTFYFAVPVGYTPIFWHAATPGWKALWGQVAQNVKRDPASGLWVSYDPLSEYLNTITR